MVNVGVIIDDCLTVLNIEAVRKPILHPIKAKEHCKNTKIEYELQYFKNFYKSWLNPMNQ